MLVLENDMLRGYCPRMAMYTGKPSNIRSNLPNWFPSIVPHRLNFTLARAPRVFQFVKKRKKNQDYKKECHSLIFSTYTLRVLIPIFPKVLIQYYTDRMDRSSLFHLTTKHVHSVKVSSRNIYRHSGSGKVQIFELSCRRLALLTLTWALDDLNSLQTLGV